MSEICIGSTSVDARKVHSIEQRDKFDAGARLRVIRLLDKNECVVFEKRSLVVDTTQADALRADNAATQALINAVHSALAKESLSLVFADFSHGLDKN